MADEKPNTPEGSAADTKATDAKSDAAKTTAATGAGTPSPATPPPPGTKPPAPEKYDLKLPDGSPLGTDAIERTAAFAKERGLTNDIAQALLARDHDLAVMASQTQEQQAVAAREQWVQQGRADQEIGGAKFSEHVALAARVVSRFGTDQFKQALESTGLGNHPELVRVFARIGRLMSDDQFVMPGQRAPEPEPKKGAEEILYGKAGKPA